MPRRQNKTRARAHKAKPPGWLPPLVHADPKTGELLYVVDVKTGKPLEFLDAKTGTRRRVVSLERKALNQASALNPVVESTIAALNQKEALPRQSVTNERLAAIWPAWCALPTEFDATERDSILTGRNLAYGDYQKHYHRLTKEFKNLLPLDLAEYHETLNALSEWWRLMVAARRCTDKYKDEIESQLRYESFDKKIVGFVAAHRMYNEFAADRPDLLMLDKCPTLKALDCVRRRYDAYAQGRRDAVEILSGLIFSPSLMAERDLPFENQSVEFSQPRFPRHLFVARLKAFGKCSDRTLTHFMTKDFFQLSHDERYNFCKEYAKPTDGNENYNRLRLWAWLAENAPVFNFCEAGWTEIFKAVAARFKRSAPDGCHNHPPDAEGLKTQWHVFTLKHGLTDPRRITPPRRRRKLRPVIPSTLLTPPPDFSKVN